MQRSRRLGIAAGTLLAAAAWSCAVAQTAPAQPRPAASAAPAATPEKRILTPAESRDSATMPGDLRPERPVTPQISIPLNKAGQAAPKPVLNPPPRAKPTSSGGIDDSAARCAALADAQARDQCRDKIAR